MPSVQDMVKENLELAKKAIQEEAALEASEKPAETSSTETIEAYVNRMVAEHPTDTIVPGEFPETTPIPGFEQVNLGLAAIYGIKWGALATFLDAKEKVFHPHIIPTQIGIHITRGFSRKEWGDLQQKILEDTKNRLTHHEEQGTDQKWREIDIQMRTEEMIACAGTVEPTYSRETIRKIPAGVVSYIANSIMQASGYEQQPLPALPLK